MTAPGNPNSNQVIALPGYDPINHYQGIALQVAAPVQDQTTGIWYAPLVSNRNYDSLTLIPYAAYTSNQTSANQTNMIGKGVLLFIKTGSFGSGESTLTVTLQGEDPISSTTYTILQSASLTANSFTLLRVYPGLTAAANTVANDLLPATWNVTATATAWGTGGSTIGVSACVMI